MQNISSKLHTDLMRSIEEYLPSTLTICRRYSYVILLLTDCSFREVTELTYVTLRRLMKLFTFLLYRGLAMVIIVGRGGGK